MYSRETEIRHLTSLDIYKLGLILDQTNSWKKLMRIIPQDISREHIHRSEVTAKYTNDHIKLIENASIKQNRMSTEILFDEWGTSGKNRPTIGILLELLVDAELFRAAEFVAVSFLNEPHPPRPTKGPAAKVDISMPLATEEIRAIEEMLNDAPCPGTNSINENAQIASDLMNKDFYEKYGKNYKKLDFEFSDFMKFTSNLQELNPPEQIPIQLIATKNITIKNLQSAVSSKIDSNANQNSSSCNKSDTVERSIYDIPILSALINDEENTDEQILPDLSAFNISDGAAGDNRSNSRSGSFGNSSSLSVHTDDEGDNLTPNLSILDQKSNDSSLTHVTDTTSENISFEIDANNENCTTVESNIPCLTDLQN